jgi:hypothetical protein
LIVFVNRKTSVAAAKVVEAAGKYCTIGESGAWRVAAFHPVPIRAVPGQWKKGGLRRSHVIGPQGEELKLRLG